MSIIQKELDRGVKLTLQMTYLLEQEEGDSLGEKLEAVWLRIYGNKPSEADVDAFCRRLEEERALVEEAEERSSEQSSEQPEKNKKSLGTERMKWVAELPEDRLCLWIADYDWEKAVHLYCNVDYLAVREMANLKSEDVFFSIHSNFESVMFGFGGDYEDQDEGVIDVSTEEGMAEMDAAFGF